MKSMHIKFDAVCQGGSKFAHENRKTQTSNNNYVKFGPSLTNETRYFDALTQTFYMYFCTYSGLQKTLNIH